MSCGDDTAPGGGGAGGISGGGAAGPGRTVAGAETSRGGTAGGEDPSGDPQNGQIGSIGASECFRDEQCEVDMNALTEPIGTVALAAARCDHQNVDPLPVCHCDLRITPTAESGRQPFMATEYAGLRPGGCSVFGRGQECLYCAADFPGCRTDEPGSCDATCADLSERINEEFSRAFDATARLARCTEDNTCVRLFELEGTCYAGSLGVRWLPPLDCSQSDAALLARHGERVEAPCDAPAPASCETALDCPAGLACNDGRCGRCADQCSYPTGQPELAVCDGDANCAPDELCAMGTCVPEENLECRFFTQCPDGDCVLSGLDPTSERGNESTRTFCSSRGCSPPQFDDQGNRRMLPDQPPGCP